MLFFALPAVVAPEPERRIAVDCLFKHLQICPRVRELLSVLHWLYGLERQAIMAAPGLLDVDVKIFGANVIANRFAARNIRRLLAQESGPVMQRLREWPLVSYEAANKVLTLALHLQQAPDGLLHRDALRAESAADFEHQPVHNLIAKRMINLAEQNRLLGA